jgi:hypothetical protein
MTSTFEFICQLRNLSINLETSLEEQKLLCSPIAEIATQTAQQVMEKFWGTFFAVRAAVKNIATNGSITLMPGISIFKTSKLGGISVISAANGANSSQHGSSWSSGGYRCMEQSRRVQTSSAGKVGRNSFACAASWATRRNRASSVKFDNEFLYYRNYFACRWWFNRAVITVQL